MREFEWNDLRFFLAVALVAPFAVPGRGTAARAARISLWTIGWLTWLMGGPISFLHAFG